MRQCLLLEALYNHNLRSGSSVITTGHVTVFYKINRAANLDNVYYNYPDYLICDIKP